MTDPSPVNPDEPRSSFGDTVRDGAVPEAELAAAVRARPTGPGMAGRGPVRWVRAADAVAELTSATAGRGIDLHRAIAHRIRSTPAAVQPAVADRLRSVPSPVRAAPPARPGTQLERNR